MGEAAECETKSKKFKGICLSASNCASICKTENFQGGNCRGITRMWAQLRWKQGFATTGARSLLGCVWWGTSVTAAALARVLLGDIATACVIFATAIRIAKIEREGNK
nr:defensin Ec-AMP-D1-like [Ipomoea trifida]GMD19769.1 defensin Ec-AMP-D2-like [Ipomoea batatas]